MGTGVAGGAGVGGAGTSAWIGNSDIEIRLLRPRPSRDLGLTWTLIDMGDSFPDLAGRVFHVPRGTAAKLILSDRYFNESQRQFQIYRARTACFVINK
jgi:hypothetical protein